MTYNDVIQRLGANHAEGILEGGGQRAISLAGLWVTGGMVVNQNHRCRIELQRNLDHFSRVHAGTIQRASEQFPEAYYPMFGIEQ